jgi:hypothetical protein
LFQSLPKKQIEEFGETQPCSVSKITTTPNLLENKGKEKQRRKEEEEKNTR